MVLVKIFQINKNVIFSGTLVELFCKLPNDLKIRV